MAGRAVTTCEKLSEVRKPQLIFSTIGRCASDERDRVNDEIALSHGSHRTPRHAIARAEKIATRHAMAVDRVTVMLLFDALLFFSGTRREAKRTDVGDRYAQRKTYIDTSSNRWTCGL